MTQSEHAVTTHDPSPWAKGLVHVYTGDGKGKTTAALGVVLRALGHGLTVHIVSFMKGDTRYGEQAALARLLARYGERETPPPSPEPDTERECLRTLRRHHDWLRREIGSARDRLEAARHSPWTPASVRHSLERVLRELEAEA